MRIANGSLEGKVSFMVGLAGIPDWRLETLFVLEIIICFISKFAEKEGKEEVAN